MNGIIYPDTQLAAAPEAAPGTFGAMRARLLSLSSIANKLGIQAEAVKSAIVGASPEKDQAEGPRPVPNGHIENLDALMDDLSANLNRIGDALTPLSNKI